MHASPIPIDVIVCCPPPCSCYIHLNLDDNTHCHHQIIPICASPFLFTSIIYCAAIFFLAVALSYSHHVIPYVCGNVISHYCIIKLLFLFLFIRLVGGTFSMTTYISVFTSLTWCFHIYLTIR